ncbi:TetR/AcrR family transcriptional regulator [Streptomyces cinereospinus]
MGAVNPVDAVATGTAVDRVDRVPKQDRSRATRQRLLEAAVACLAEHGWAGSTVAVVAERAGVSAAPPSTTSRPARTSSRRRWSTSRRNARPPCGPCSRRARPATAGPSSPPWSTSTRGRCSGPPCTCGSPPPTRTSCAPRVTELEARVGRETHRIAVDLLAADETRPGARETVQGLLDMARGLGLANLLTDDGPRRERVVAQWADLLDAALG